MVVTCLSVRVRCFLLFRGAATPVAGSAKKVPEACEIAVVVSEEHLHGLALIYGDLPDDLAGLVTQGKP
jgi:hypothetical protein